MDGGELILTEAVSPPSLLGGKKGTVAGSKDDTQAAKDFESVLICRLVDQMKDTIGDWGFEKDGASKQVNGIFWLYLGKEIGNQGGLGLWKDIHQFYAESGRTSCRVDSSG